METEYITQLQHILERMTVGVAILDCATLRVLYANSYLTSFCPEPWKTLGLVGRLAGEILPADIYRLAEIPYEGFLETRGRTYWRISLELTPAPQEIEEKRGLLVMLEDVTSSVR